MPLKIDIPASEFYDDEHDEFISVREQTITLEHSLVSIAKWEAKWHIPFFNGTKSDKTNEQIIDYVKFMTLTQNVDPNVYLVISTNSELVNQINAYIEDPMTATTFKKGTPPNPHQVITNEVIYWQMIALGIPIEFQKWHFNRLQTLIRVAQEKSNGKKMSKTDILRSNAELNAARRKMLHSKG